MKSSGDDRHPLTICPTSQEIAIELEQYIGRYARSVESGWLGKVIAVEGDMLKMQGVNELCRTIAGGEMEEHLDDDDFQWFDPNDLKFLKKAEAKVSA